MKFHITYKLPRYFKKEQKEYEEEGGWWAYYGGKLHIFIYPSTSLRKIIEYAIHESVEAVLEHYLHLSHKVAHKVALFFEKFSLLIPNKKVVPIEYFRKFVVDNNIQLIKLNKLGEDLVLYMYDGYTGFYIHVDKQYDLLSHTRRYEIVENFRRKIERDKEYKILKDL